MIGLILGGFVYLVASGFMSVFICLVFWWLFAKVGAFNNDGLLEVVAFMAPPIACALFAGVGLFYGAWSVRGWLFLGL